MRARAGLIISTKQARKLLGRDAKGLSDDEIEAVIITLTDLAAVFLRAPTAPTPKQDTIQP